jgi:hypothetical protein
VPHVDVGGVAEQPGPDLPDLSYARDEQDEEHRVVDREDPQEPARVELAHEEQTAARVMPRKLTAADQDARDEEAAEDEEEPHAEIAPVEPADDRRV